MKHYFLFNPLAGKGKAKQLALGLDPKTTEGITCRDMTKISDFRNFLSTLNSDDRLIICGGDGTLNGFVNATSGVEIKNEIHYFPAGSGNDFMKDLNRTEADGNFVINEYIKNLPTVTIKGKDYRFLNGVGFGIDGFVCNEGNRLRGNGKKVDYTSLAIKCLMKFRPVNATVTVDGETKNYKKVWMTTTMKGRFFGGGMMITPDQKRDDSENKISVLVVHDISRMGILSLFPSIFKGEHVKYTKYVDLIRCDSISVKYDRPCDLQIDGEPISDVNEYSATTIERVTV